MPGVTELLFWQFLSNQMQLLDNISRLVQSKQYSISLHVYCTGAPVQKFGLRFRYTVKQGYIMQNIMVRGGGGMASRGKNEIRI